MKSIQTFIAEKLRIKKGNVNTIKIPHVDHYADETIDTDDIWREFVIPDGKYVIYKDKYHSDYPHISTLDDMISNMMINQDDFEDFKFNDDILYATDDEQDLIEWLCENILHCELPDNKKFDTSDDWIDTLKNNKKRKVLDNLYFIYDLYNGNDKMTGTDFNNNYDIKNIANIMSDYIY